MFSFIGKDVIPDERLMEISRPLADTVREQLSTASAVGKNVQHLYDFVVSGGLESKLPDCLQSGYLIGYIFGLSNVFGALACKDNNIKRSAVEKNVLHLYDFVMNEAFAHEPSENYKGLLTTYIETQPPAFQRGQFDGEFDSETRLKHGEFSTCLATRGSRLR